MNTACITFVIPIWALLIIAISAWVQIGLSVIIVYLRWWNGRLTKRLAERVATGLVDKAVKVAGQ